MKLKDLLRLHEGERNLPYEDSVGKLTIGVGHNLDRPISARAIEVILDDDIAEAKADLDKVFPKWQSLTETRQNTLIEMMFNMGRPRFLKFIKFWEALKRDDYKAAAKEMLQSRWAGQVGERATRLSKMMIDG